MTTEMLPPLSNARNKPERYTKIKLTNYLESNLIILMVSRISLRITPLRPLIHRTSSTKLFKLFHITRFSIF